MKKMLLVDGNSMFFRAYYATAYTHLSANSKGVFTNAVFGFATMLNKAIELVDPQAMIIAFDSGKKTFRHDEYAEYKGTRKELPTELIQQFPLVREYCERSGYCYYQHDGLEADDIIGSLVKRYPDWDINVLSSDKDLLQLIDNTTSVWLMKKGLTEIVKMDSGSLMEMYKLRPDQIPDLKGLMGDASDNIPGLPGVGEKTALKLLEEYESVENVIANVDKLKGKLQETVKEFKDQAMFSKWLATIKTDAELDLDLEGALYHPTIEGMNAFLQDYEMRSLIKQTAKVLTVLSDTGFSDLDQKHLAIFPHYSLEDIWPHTLIGIAFSDTKQSVYIKSNQFSEIKAYLASDLSKIIYDLKTFKHALEPLELSLNGLCDDLMIMMYLDDSTLSTYTKIQTKYGWPTYPIAIVNEETINQCRHIASKMREDFELIYEKIKMKDMAELYTKIELPLCDVLYEMEKTGILLDEVILDEIADKTLTRLNLLSAQIIQDAGVNFNINSPKQLADVLFTTLKLPSNKKLSTSIDVLEGLKGQHPIIEQLIEYRKFQKLYSTYALGLKKYIHKDQRIHTVYSQISAQTGRLSSYDPNLQNISIRDNETREIRKAFIPDPDCVLFACDYSQIELRVLAHMASETALISAFKLGLDIHTKTAMDVFHLKADEVDGLRRRQAKAINFGIVYGISDFGFAAQTGTDRKTAKTFIDTYLNTYSGIKTFMDQTILMCENQGYVNTLFKRRREIPEIYDKTYMVREAAKRAAMNAPVQGTAADIMKIAMINVRNALLDQKLKSRVILQVHDELVLNVPKEELERVTALVIKQMQEAVKLDVPLEVSYSSGKDWYEAK